MVVVIVWLLVELSCLYKILYGHWPRDGHKYGLRGHIPLIVIKNKSFIDFQAIAINSYKSHYQMVTIEWYHIALAPWYWNWKEADHLVAPTPAVVTPRMSGVSVVEPGYSTLHCCSYTHCLTQLLVKTDIVRQLLCREGSQSHIDNLSIELRIFIPCIWAKPWDYNWTFLYITNIIPMKMHESW